MLFDKRFSLKTVYYRSFLLLIVIPILLVSVISLTLTRYIMERSAITNIRNAQASIERQPRPRPSGIYPSSCPTWCT
ncbi:MAG: hypothetical protein ACLTW9_13655 [Enterocloster sp.]